MRIQSYVTSFLIFLVVGFQCACVDPKTSENIPNSNNPDASSSPRLQIQNASNRPIVGEDVHTDRILHEQLYRDKMAVASVARTLTELNAKFITKEPTVNEQIARERKIIALVEKLKTNASDLLALAKICRVLEMHGKGLNKLVSPYDIAFLMCVRTLSTDHRNKPGVADEIEHLKAFGVDGHLAEEFALVSEGKYPSFLFSDDSSR